MLTDLDGVTSTTAPDASLSVTDASAQSLDASDASTFEDGGDGGGSADPYGAEVLADSPAVYLRLDEATGRVARDSSGNGRDGDIIGSLTWNAPGFATSTSTGATFDGLTSAIDLGASLDFHDTAPFTIELWAHAELADMSFRHLVTKDAKPVTGTEAYYLYLYDNMVSFERSVQGQIAGVRVSAAPILNRWTHIAGTYDGTQLLLYLDGVAVGGRPDSRAQLVKSGHLYVGTKNLQGGVIKGAIDEVAIYDRALSASRIAAHVAAAR